MFQTRKSFTVNNNISSLPFSDLGEACRVATAEELPAIVEDFGASFGIKSKSWVYPQCFARVGKWTPSRGVNGKYDSIALLSDNCTKSPVDMGIYYFLTSNSRFVMRQYSSGKDYCALVPLILAAQKKMNDVKYSEWDSNVRVLVDKKLYEAMTTDYADYTKDELLEARRVGLTVKSGKAEGTTKSAVSTFGINGTPAVISRGDVQIEGLSTLPPLVRVMLCQTWCAHPSNRTKYMILDPKDWDNMPPALAEDNPFREPKEVAEPSLLPW